MIPELLAGWAPTPVTRPFWDAAAAGRLEIQTCESCGRLQHPPRVVCTACGGEPSWRELSGRGNLYSFTVVERGLIPELWPRVPYVIGVVELEEGPRMTSVVRVAEPLIGMALEVAFETVGTAATLPVFDARKAIP